MVQPIIIQPNYMNAMTQGLGTNLAYVAESKKGGGNIMRGGGSSGPTKQEQVGIDRKVAAENRRKEDAKRNALYKERQDAEEKITRHEEGVAAKEETTRKADFMEQLKSYAPAVTQSNYDDYLAFAKEGGVEFPGVMSPGEVSTMDATAFKEYMGGFFGGKKTTGKTKSVKEQVIGKYIAGDKMTERETKFVEKELGEKQRVTNVSEYIEAKKKVFQDENPGKLPTNKQLLQWREEAMKMGTELKGIAKLLGLSEKDVDPQGVF